MMHMIKASKAPEVLSGYNILICKPACNGNILYLEMCAAPFAALIMYINLTPAQGILLRTLCKNRNIFCHKQRTDSGRRHG